MADLLEQWLAHRGWCPIVHHDAEAERYEVHAGLVAAGIRADLALIYDECGSCIRVAIVPDHNLDSWKCEQAEELVDAIGDPGLWVFRNQAGYQKIGYRLGRSLDGDHGAIDLIDEVVEQVIDRWGSWAEDLRTFSITNTTVATILADRADRPHDRLRPSWRLVIDSAEFERRLQHHLETTPCPAGSFMAALHWGEEQRDELRESLIAQNFIVA